MKHIVNIIIGKPTVPWEELCTDGTAADIEMEKEQTLFTDQRNLSKILKEIGAVSSIGEVRRNKPELCKEFVNPDCFWLKWGKQRFWVVVGGEDR